MTNDEIMAMSNEELDARREAREDESRKEYEFAKFKVKMKMTAEQIAHAVKERDFDDARDNPDFLWDLIGDWHKNTTEEEFLDYYLDYIYNWENDDE